jgi:hypothetical protein
MSSAKKSPGTRKARKIRSLAALNQRNSWTVAEAAGWSGIPLRSLYALLKQGSIPCLSLGESQTQQWDKASDGKRRRSCFRFIIPRVAFIKWFEGISTPNQGGIAA